MDIHQAPYIYERVIHYDEVKDIQVRLTVNTFRGVEYLAVRKYYRDFHDEWQPTKEGVTFPIDFQNSRELFEGMAEILSLAESRSVIEQYFGDIISAIYLGDEI